MAIILTNHRPRFRYALHPLKRLDKRQVHRCCHDRRRHFQYFLTTDDRLSHRPVTWQIGHVDHARNHQETSDYFLCNAHRRHVAVNTAKALPSASPNWAKSRMRVPSL